MQDLIHQDLISSEGIFQEKELKKITSVSGGCIHKSWCIELLDGKKFFAKTTSNKDFPMLKFEANCLKQLKKYSNEEYLKVPEIIKIKQFRKNSILLLNWINLDRGDQTKLGKGLAYMHKASFEKHLKKFGWADDGFIGINIQKGGWNDNWGVYFVNFRLQPQLALAFENGFINQNYKKYLPNFINFLNKNEPNACLVHGDLWSGNSATSKSSEGIIFDPASYWADREVDIAMTRLFGGFSKDFYSGYNSIWKLSSTAEERIDIYNLYHIINHANIFKGNYINQTITLLNKVINQVKD